MSYPAFMMALCAVLFQMKFAFSDAPTIAADFVLDASSYFLLARLVSAAAGAATVLVVYAITRRLTSRSGAIAAALLFAVSPLAVRDAHFGVTDTLLALLCAATVSALLRYLEAGPAEARRRLIYVAVFLGLAVATKYPAAVLASVVLAAVILKNDGIRKEGLIQALLLIATAATLFALINPYLFVKPAAADGLRGILSVVFGQQPGAGGWSPASAVLQMMRPLRHGPGESVGLILCALGMVWPVKETSVSRLRLVLLLAVGAWLLLLIFSRHLLYYRYVLSLLPLLAVFAGKGVSDLLHVTAARAWRFTMVAGVALLAGHGLWTCHKTDRLLAREDSRALAGRWLRENVSPEVPIFLFVGPEAEPQVPESAASIHRRIQYARSLYGTAAGEVVAQFYRLYLEGLAELGEKGATRYEVFRDANVAASAAPIVAVVRSEYPVALTSGGISAAELPKGKIIRRKKIKALPLDEPQSYEFDRIDAFFLPFNRLSDLKRPGPTLEITLLERDQIQSE
jgi:hypothetical protein